MTEMGEIPEEWEVVKLGTILNLKNGESPKTYKDSNIPIYGANGIIGYTKDFLVDNDFTIIIGRVGASGEVHLGKRKIWISDNAIYSETHQRSIIYLPFLFYLLKYKKLNKFASKTTHPIITQTFLNNFLIQLPNFEEQKKIAEILSTVDEKLELLKGRREHLEKLKKVLMNDLLTGKVRVKTESSGSEN